MCFSSTIWRSVVQTKDKIAFGKFAFHPNVFTIVGGKITANFGLKRIMDEQTSAPTSGGTVISEYTVIIAY